MGISASARNALKIALPHAAANEVIGLLDFVAEALTQKNEAESKSAAPPEPAAGPTTTPDDEGEPNPDADPADAPVES